MNEYVNIEGMNPGTGYKPKGFLGGMTWAQDRNRYEDMAKVQDFLYKLGAQKATDEYGDYKLDAPVRAAERPAKMARFGAEAETAIPKARGVLEELQLKNRKTRGTIDSEIASENDVNAGKGAEARLGQFDAVVEWLDRQKESLNKATDGLAQQAQWAQIYQALPPQLRNGFTPEYNPENLGKIERLAEAVRTKKFSHQRDLAKEDNKAEGRLAGIEMSTKAMLERENVRLAAKEKEIEARAERDKTRVTSMAALFKQAMDKAMSTDPEKQAEGRYMLEHIQELNYKGIDVPVESLNDPNYWSNRRRQFGDPLKPAAPSGDPNERVRVVKPDGTPGTIPRSQLEAAKKEGWKEVQ